MYCFGMFIPSEKLNASNLEKDRSLKNLLLKLILFSTEKWIQKSFWKYGKQGGVDKCET